MDAARWLLGPSDDLEPAIRARLAGVALAATSLSDDKRARLRVAARREAADRARAVREAADVLDALRHLEVVVWKGLAVARRWPHPELRPAGDLDILIAPADLKAAQNALMPFARPRGTSPGSLAYGDPPFAVELWPVEGRTLAVDLQTRPFRTVGSGLDGSTLLARAHSANIAGVACRILDPTDELLLVLVHAAKHGARAPRWILDAVALATDASWPLAHDRAVAAGVTRPLSAMTALLRHLHPGSPLPTWPRPFGAGFLCDLDRARLSQPLSQWERYRAEIVLEENPWHLLARTRDFVSRRFFLSSRSRQR